MGAKAMKTTEIKKLIKGPIATVPTPFDENFEIDYGRMAELAEMWVEQGLVKGKAVIKVAAAMGEGPMLSDSEWPALLRTVVQAAKGDAAVMCGLHFKDTKRTIEDAKKAQDMGAIGLQVCPPIFNLPSQKDIADYFCDLSKAIDIGVMVYVTQGMDCPISLDTYREMADFENIVAIKWSNKVINAEYEDIFELSDSFNIIDNTSQPILCHKNGGDGYINLTAEVYPPHDLKIWNLMENGDYSEAQDLFDSVNNPLRDFYGKTAVRSGGQGRVKKGLMHVMGNSVGSSRPPSKPLNLEELNELREIVRGFGWPVK
ncbi:MAG: dihydrodipicolinate synthase family protein [SAR202 cluster bacterium]|nr:dihydrodipicolinate synthase family protein [SAR202 cluster bacterium]|tara:strand:+ start:2648 stop:3592 length:945 start_codon:yes stop_codon:yes gene_type:complete